MTNFVRYYNFASCCSPSSCSSEPPDLILKLIGVGLAAAIFVDAILVRMVLLPASMRLLGERAWWTPGAKRLPTAPRSAVATGEVGPKA